MDIINFFRTRHVSKQPDEPGLEITPPPGYRPIYYSIYSDAELQKYTHQFTNTSLRLYRRTLLNIIKSQKDLQAFYPDSVVPEEIAHAILWRSVERYITDHYSNSAKKPHWFDSSLLNKGKNGKPALFNAIQTQYLTQEIEREIRQNVLKSKAGSVIISDDELLKRERGIEDILDISRFKFHGPAQDFSTSFESNMNNSVYVDVREALLALQGKAPQSQVEEIVDRAINKLAIVTFAQSPCPYSNQYFDWETLTTNPSKKEVLYISIKPYLAQEIEALAKQSHEGAPGHLQKLHDAERTRNTSPGRTKAT